MNEMSKQERALEDQGYWEYLAEKRDKEVRAWEKEWVWRETHRLGQVVERLDALCRVLLSEINELRAFRGQEPLDEDQRPF